MKLLHIDTSLLGEASVTRDLTALIVRRLTDGTQADVTYLDLDAEPLPALSRATLPSAHPAATPESELDETARAERARSDRALETFLAADTVVIGAPLYNFSVPGTLKAWIDRIAVPGKTFSYGADGPKGLAGGKRVIVAIARGGFYGPESGYASAEHAESFLRALFGFIGVSPEFIVAEGLSRGDANRATALESAREAIGQLA